MNKLKYHTRDQRITESVNITLMNRWKKRYILKVFKILRKQNKNESHVLQKKRISKSKIKHIKRS